jgi:thiol-disulfide isomerase/thioredoxin
MKKKSSSPAFIQIGKFKLNLMQALIPGLVLILVGLILLVKSYQANTEAAVAPSAQSTPTLPAAPADKKPQPDAPTADMLPEAQLNYFIAAKKPTLAFFHSNNCVQCIKMMEVVEQVHPDFAGQVALVDVDVYDQRNENFLRQASIRVIPTMIFIDRTSQGVVYTGPMAPDEFRAELQRLAKE